MRNVHVQYILIAVLCFAVSAPVRAADKKFAKTKITLNDDFIESYELHRDIERLEILNGLKFFAEMRDQPLPVPLPVGQDDEGLVLGHVDESGSWVSDYVVVPVVEKAGGESIDDLVEFVSDDEFKVLVEEYQSGAITARQLRQALVGR